MILSLNVRLELIGLTTVRLENGQARAGVAWLEPSCIWRTKKVLKTRPKRLDKYRCLTYSN
jgi:hypothetical protein